MMRLFEFPAIQTALKLGDMWGKPLFELVPQFLPFGHLSTLEIQLWAQYFDQKAQQNNG
jgi:hypothetical protein